MEYIQAANTNIWQDKKDRYQALIPMPGIPHQDINVERYDNCITLSGSNTDLSLEYERVINIPDNVGDPTVRFIHGLCIVTAIKAPSIRRNIPVTV